MKTRLPIYLLVGVTTVLGYLKLNSGTLLFMNWTADDGLASLVSLLYHQQQIKTFDQELKIILTTAYYFSVFTILYYAIAELYERIIKKEENDFFIISISQIYSNYCASRLTFISCNIKTMLTFNLHNPLLQERSLVFIIYLIWY